LHDGVEALLKVVDSKVNWVLPDRWNWIPGKYEWSFETKEGVSPEVLTSSSFNLQHDGTCEYTLERTTKTKKENSANHENERVLETARKENSGQEQQK